MTENDGPTTAHVEVLTAEVRVLEVGNRRVTLTDYRQLDTAGPDDVEAFGRVHDSQDRNKKQRSFYKRVYVVGRHRKTGALVRASTPHEGNVAYVEKGDVTAGRDWIIANRRKEETGDVVIPAYAWTPFPQQRTVGCSVWVDLITLAEDRSEPLHWTSTDAAACSYGDAEADVLRWRAWHALPLIVLGGR